MKSIFATAAIVATAGIATANTEVTNNGGFETGDTSGWESFPGPSSSFEVTNIPGEVNDGNWAGVLTNDGPPSGALIKQANLAVGLVNPGDEIEISFSLNIDVEAGGVITAEFFSELAGGGTSASEILGGSSFIFDTDGYEDFTFTTTAGPDVSGGITLQIVAATGGADGSFAQVFIDNVSVVVVPSPAGVAMLGAGGLLVARRRR